MKITIERSALLKALSHVQSVVERRNTIPILANVLIEATKGKLSLTATDMDLAIVESVPAEVGKSGATTVPAHTLYDVVRKLPEDVSQANARKDEIFIDRLFEQWRARGIALDCSPGLFFGLSRALFFVSLRADEIGAENYPAVVELLIDVIANRIVKE